MLSRAKREVKSGEGERTNQQVESIQQTLRIKHPSLSFHAQQPPTYDLQI